MAKRSQLLIEQVVAILPCWLSELFRKTAEKRAWTHMFILHGAPAHIARFSGCLV
jgi:hypothetical protein